MHQGSALSPLLLIVVMQEVVKDRRRKALWELLYADDLVLVAESEAEVVDSFNEWKSLLEKRGMKVNMEKNKS